MNEVVTCVMIIGACVLVLGACYFSHKNKELNLKKPIKDEQNGEKQKLINRINELEEIVEKLKNGNQLKDDQKQ